MMHEMKLNCIAIVEDAMDDLPLIFTICYNSFIVCQAHLAYYVPASIQETTFHLLIVRLVPIHMNL
jgi:hypothetical protein